jgi:hypothetical protein
MISNEIDRQGEQTTVFAQTEKKITQKYTMRRRYSFPGVFLKKVHVVDLTHYDVTWHKELWS